MAAPMQLINYGAPPGQIPDVNNWLGSKNVYPSVPGATSGTIASAASPFSFLTRGSAETPSASTPQGQMVSLAEGGTGLPMGSGNGRKAVAWWIVAAALLVVLMWVSQRFGSEGAQFHSVRLSLYNIVVIALAAVIGIAFFKVLFNKVKVPGLTEFVNAV